MRRLGGPSLLPRIGSCGRCSSGASKHFTAFNKPRHRKRKAESKVCARLSGWNLSFRGRSQLARMSCQRVSIFFVQPRHRQQAGTPARQREIMAHLQGMNAADKRGRVLRLAQQEGGPLLFRNKYFVVPSFFPIEPAHREMAVHPPRLPRLCLSAHCCATVNQG